MRVDATVVEVREFIREHRDNKGDIVSREPRYNVTIRPAPDGAHPAVNHDIYLDTDEVFEVGQETTITID